MGEDFKGHLITLDQLSNDIIGRRVSWCKPGTDEFVEGTLQDYAIIPTGVYLYIWGKDNRMAVETTTNITHTLMVME